MVPRLAMSIVVDKWRRGVFSGDTSAKDYNAAWWAPRQQYQGLSPSVTRTEDDFDAGMFFHISFNVPCDRYFDGVLRHPGATFP
jgi:peptidyl-dipeptidase A